MSDGFWPLAGLRVESADLLLRPMTEADLEPLARELTGSPDIELDPSLPSYGDLDPAVARGRALHQFYWRSLGDWRPGSWRLLLVAQHADQLIGSQDLKGNRFGTTRTVETASYLFRPWRGRGFGVQMRRAVLTLAFDHLGALAAETEAWHDNAASLGVSQAVGYQPNGETLHQRGDGVDRMLRMRLTRERWQALGGSAGIRVSGLDACRDLFGGVGPEA